MTSPITRRDALAAMAAGVVAPAFAGHPTDVVT